MPSLIIVLAFVKSNAIPPPPKEAGVSSLGFDEPNRRPVVSFFALNVAENINPILPELNPDFLHTMQISDNFG